MRRLIAPVLANVETVRRKPRRVSSLRCSRGLRVQSIPDLTTYDVIEVSSSAGKDSQAMVRYVCALARAAGVLARVVVVHADLGRVEWPGTRELAETQARILGAPRFIAVKRRQGDLLQHVEQMGYWPKPDSRYCTADHKRAQIHRALTQLANEVRVRLPVEERESFDRKGQRRVRKVKRPIRVLNCVGLRAEESADRAKRAALSRDRRASGKGTRKIVDVWLPIQDWTESEVWLECFTSGAPIHPAYAAGLPRASCIFCIYAPEAALQIAGLAHPELLAEYVRVERAIGHDFKHRLPLAKVQVDLAAGVRPSGRIESWCM